MKEILHAAAGAFAANPALLVASVLVFCVLLPSFIWAAAYLSFLQR